MKIDKELQKECYNKAIKKVASNYELTQKYVRSKANRRTYKERLRGIYEICIQNAVKNWTVEFYNREMERRYLPVEQRRAGKQRSKVP